MSTAYEVEYNDERAFATFFENSITGALDSVSDVDWYKIYFSNNAMTTIIFDTSAMSNGIWSVNWYTPDMVLLSGRNIDAGGFAYEMPTFSTGTYYLRVQATASVLYSGGSYTITARTDASTPEIDVSGNGVPIADGDTTPTSSDWTNFGSVTQGGSTVSRVFTVSNAGSADLTTAGLSVPAGFVVTEGLSSVIASGNSDTFAVRFDSTTVGTNSGQISFATNDTDENPFNFTVTGVVQANGVIKSGTDGDDVLQGTTGNDSIAGLAGNDQLQGFSGADTLDGGSETDTVTYTGSTSGYRFGFNANNEITIRDIDTSDGNDGIDTVLNIERASFADGFVTLQVYGETKSYTEAQTTAPYEQVFADITALSDGGYVLAWQSAVDNGGNYDIHVQRYAANDQLVGGETRVNTTTAYGQNHPAIAALSDGGYLVTWEGNGADDNYGVYSQRYDTAGFAMGDETLINTATVDEQSHPAIAVLTDGGYVVTWRMYNHDSYEHGIYARRYDSSGHPVGNEIRINTTTGRKQETPAITALSDGGYVVTWESTLQDGNVEIYAQRYAVGGDPEGAETQINTWTSDYQTAPAITALVDGGYVVTWQSNAQDGSGFGIYAQRYSADGDTVGDEKRINTTTFDNQEQPAITALPDGGYVVTWSANYSASTSSSSRVYAQRFDAAGNAVGSETQINTTTATALLSPRIATLADGGYVVTWQGYGSGDVRGIYAQRYDAFGNTVELTGDAHSNALSWTGDAGASLYGLGGNDTLDGGGGRDRIDGGEGFDTASYAAYGSAVTINLGDPSGNPDTLLSIEHVSGSAYNDHLAGDTGANALLGFAGNDTLLGGLGVDTLDGGPGIDILTGGSGNDTYVVTAGDVVTEYAGEGLDTVQSAGNWTLDSNIEVLVLSGTGATSGTGNSEANSLSGNAAANALNGSGGNDTIAGGGGNDTLDGGSGADRLSGQKGSDVYIVDGSDTLIESVNQGIDTVQSAASWTLAANFEKLILTGGGTAAGTGNTAANTITGSSAANKVSGLAGADVLIGLGGNDSLKGGIGNDSLTGGDGADSFYFDTNLSSTTNVDQVSDFASGTDKLRLDDDIFSAFNFALAKGLKPAQFYSDVSATAAHDADDRIIYNTSTGALYYDPDGNGAIAAVEFAVLGLNSHPTITAADFAIVA